MKTSQFTRVRLGIVGIFLVLTGMAILIFSQWPDEYVHIVVCDVGQGDAILLTQGFSQVVIDAGVDEEQILQCLREHLPFWDRQIDWIVPTHLDADHIGGFPAVLDRFQVQNLLLPRDTKQTADFERFEEAVLREQDAGARLVTAQLGADVPVKPTWLLRVLYAPTARAPTQQPDFQPQTETQLWDAKTLNELNPSDSNNRSTVLSFQYGQVSVLLTGDLEEPVEQALVARGMVTKHTILKVGHHGSKSSSSDAFLQVVQPEVALVSAGQNNRYGHPADSILHRLRHYGAKNILRTDELGSIELSTDGRTVWQTSVK